jgi:signal transduction histidine kinase
LIAVFSVTAYFSDLAIGKVNTQWERQQAQLLATGVADIVEHHFKRLKIRNERRSRRAQANQTSEATLVPDWNEVQEQIEDTIAKENSLLAEVRVFQRSDSGSWNEKIRLPVDAEPLSHQEQVAITRPVEPSRAVTVLQDRNTRMVQARTAINVLESSGLTQIGVVRVLLTFDENKSSVAELRRLMWPLMLLAIITITVMTYFLFRHIVYKPIDNLLAAMSKAEAGDLAVEVVPAVSDEIGLLTSRFNRMLGRIRHMTEQLNMDQRRLEERVSDATAEIAERKQQLEEANLTLFELQRQLTQLERLAAAGQLAAQFAHEVGTPLNLISGHVQLLRARATDERVIKRLDIVASQIDRITQIVRSMLDSTRQRRPHIQPTDINSLLQQILDATQPTLMARNVAVQVNFHAGLPAIPADPDQLQQVFINLISNSLDAMPHGGTLRVATAVEKEWLEIELADSGEGIPTEQLDVIFDPFFSTKGGRGTGLGLTIVKQIVSEHNGEIIVGSEPGKMTRFQIRLPLARTQSEEELEGRTLRREPSREEPAVVTTTATKK